ncbi:MAG: hypothetical protein KDC26_08545 [Armatimonadetes bacterium]|nr:hypothetical protein [Armatimonadota bacterium]
MRLHTNLHYQASFDVRPKDGSPEAWKTLVKTVRAWMRERSGMGDELGQSWFYTYGNCKHPNVLGQFVETNREIGNGTPDQPQFWAARMQIQDSSVRDRYWCSDIGIIAQGEGEFTIGITVTHFIRHGYVGAEPVPPSFSAPKIVEQFLSDYWMPHSGDLPLTNGPLPFEVKDVPHILDLLASTERRCPIVWVARERTHLDPLVVPQGLSKKIAGAAAIIVSQDGEAESALIEALPFRFRALDGMVRIYQPGVRFDDDRDSGRHRYYSKNQIDELGASQVAVEIIRALTRRMDLGRHDAVFTLEDVQDRHRRNRLRQLRESLAPGTDTELIELFEADNKRLEEKIDELQKENEQLEFDLELAREGKQHADNQEAIATEARVEAEKQLGQAKKALEAIDHFRKLPVTVQECVELIAELHPQRIVFTKRAMRTAKNAEFNDVRSDIGDVWSLLWSLATDLHDLSFNQSLERRQLEQEFRAKSGCDISFTESDTTRSNPKLMAQRQFNYKGRELSMEPHAKLDRSDRNRFLRVHFAVDKESGLIVVNHCGDHLENAATRKRS